MYVDLMRELEATPDSYPDVPNGLSDDAAALEPAVIWGRIEAYTAHRFTPRRVVWTIMVGPDAEFQPPLAPIISREAQQFGTSTWEDVVALDGPLGLLFPGTGIHRVVAQVGGGDVPVVFLEAYWRLAEYCAETDDRAGASQYDVNMGDAMQERYRRHPAWQARAMQNSGAADLLRRYRRI